MAGSWSKRPQAAQKSFSEATVSGKSAVQIDTSVMPSAAERNVSDTAVKSAECGSPSKRKLRQNTDTSDDLSEEEITAEGHPAQRSVGQLTIQTQPNGNTSISKRVRRFQARKVKSQTNVSPVSRRPAASPSSLATSALFTASPGRVRYRGRLRPAGAAKPLRRVARRHPAKCSRSTGSGLDVPAGSAVSRGQRSLPGGKSAVRRAAKVRKSG